MLARMHRLLQQVTGRADSHASTSLDTSASPKTGSVRGYGGVLKDGEDPMKITEDEWQERLTPEEYIVTRKKGTEPPFSGIYTKEKEEGIYSCKCCGTHLFSSDTKYDSGCGWPAFNAALQEVDTVLRIPDLSHGMNRTEVRCKACDSHLGHVFPDGPQPTGERFCINSVSLKFKPKS